MIVDVHRPSCDGRRTAPNAAAEIFPVASTRMMGMPRRPASAMSSVVPPRPCAAPPSHTAIRRSDMSSTTRPPSRKTSRLHTVSVELPAPRVPYRGNRGTTCARFDCRNPFRTRRPRKAAAPPARSPCPARLPPPCGPPPSQAQRPALASARIPKSNPHGAHAPQAFRYGSRRAFRRSRARCGERESSGSLFGRCPMIPTDSAKRGFGGCALFIIDRPGILRRSRRVPQHCGPRPVR